MVKGGLTVRKMSSRSKSCHSSCEGFILTAVKSNDAVFVISVAARLVGMHANTLRKYENERLLAPARTNGNLRLYSTEDINRLQQIKTLSEQHGINVAGIRLALQVGEEIRRMREEVVGCK